MAATAEKSATTVAPGVTHFVVERPRMSARRLAEYMVASPVRQRTLVRDTKYRTVEPEISYAEGFEILGEMIADGELSTDTLKDAADDFYDRMDVRGARERIRLDLIGDLFEWLGDHRPDFDLPDDAERYDTSRTWGRGGGFGLGGVEIDPEVHLRLRRVRRNVHLGLVTLRYSKSGPLDVDVALWQSSLLHGYLAATLEDDGARAAPDLCLTLDLRTGAAHAAPGDARTRVRHMEAACASIAERWPAVAPPPKAVLA